jgi:hypothetical protein
LPQGKFNLSPDGGLTHGLRNAGLNAVAGVGINATCRYAYEKNNGGSHFAALTVMLEPFLCGEVIFGDNELAKNPI